MWAKGNLAVSEGGGASAWRRTTMLAIAAPRAPRLSPALSRMLADDLIPMSRADRMMQQSKQQLKGLKGEGKPLRDDPDSQVHIASFSKNMEARAEAEMRHAARQGMLQDLAGEGEPLRERHVIPGESGGGQTRIQNHVKRSA